MAGSFDMAGSFAKAGSFDMAGSFVKAGSLLIMLLARGRLQLKVNS